jgi:hypothetical protein
MKKVLFVLAIAIASVNVAFAQRAYIGMDVIMGSRQPNPREVNLMHAEENNHPNVTSAMHELEHAMQHLHEAPDEFGGHKAQAEADMKAAWISLRKALYFRIYQDTH